MTNTEERDWDNFETTAGSLETLLQDNDLPGDHPETLRQIEASVAMLYREDFATDKCTELLHMARRFYASKQRGARPMAEIEQQHRMMVERINSIRTRIEMMKSKPVV